ncbi:hypothetical protein [Variovorax boronicumulans]
MMLLLSTIWKAGAENGHSGVFDFQGLEQKIQNGKVHFADRGAIRAELSDHRSHGKKWFE